VNWSYLAPLGALVESGEELVNGRRVHLNQRLTCISIDQVEYLVPTGKLNINEGFFQLIPPLRKNRFGTGSTLHNQKNVKII
jgi:hypothetical protein